MFSITIQGDTLEELANGLREMYHQFQTTGAPQETKSRKAAKAAPVTTKEYVAEVVQPDPEDAALEAELNAPVPPAPATSKGIVDAGTGRPIPVGDAPIQMNMDQVRTAAAKLAAKDSPTLATILKKYGAAKLSEVPKESVGDFAADVMEQLG